MPNLIIKNVSKKTIRDLNLIAKVHKMNLNQYLKRKLKMMIAIENSLYYIMERPNKISKNDINKILEDERKKR